MVRIPSVPVRLFMHFSRNCRTYVLSHSGLFLAMLFSEALCAYFSLFTLAQLSSIASTDIEFRVIRDELGTYTIGRPLLTASFVKNLR